MTLKLDFFEEVVNKSLINIPFNDNIPIVKQSKKTNKSKSKGNTFENKIAKQLGNWIFNNNTTFTRSITSGAIKSAYVGDIIPQKQLPWKEFPFLIECKNGYKNNISDFNNTTLLDAWLSKCLKDRTNEQPIIWLIVSFHAHEPLFITDLELKLTAKIILKVENIPFYFYKFKELQEYKFYNLYSHISDLNEIFNM